MKLNPLREWFRPAPVKEEGAYSPNTWEGWLLVLLILGGLWAFAWIMMPHGNTPAR